MKFMEVLNHPTTQKVLKGIGIAVVAVSAAAGKVDEMRREKEYQELKNKVEKLSETQS